MCGCLGDVVCVVVWMMWCVCVCGCLDVWVDGGVVVGAQWCVCQGCMIMAKIIIAIILPDISIHHFDKHIN